MPGDEKRDAGKKRLRINSRTVILVPEEKCNEEYAQKVRIRMAKAGGGMSMKYLEY